ncbi:MAG: bifunctional UDP-N-acetylglucosamine diphosphorylase/glucosamine-1-phosphate N-acetyltransferase GlmU [Chloroflexi bacterium]|nr:bifunctional UDP-N-acetylglucosamine diphosphorylase/glucosamine-1-phosphate N-acetyltransferase GlmU [Chloroflexota bacterium]
MAGWAAVVLAAGRGTRMKSATPKALHPLCGAPLVSFAVQAAKEAGLSPIVLVVPPNADALRELLPEETRDAVRLAVQEQPRGTGDALLQARATLEGRAADILVLPGDAPLVTADTLLQMQRCHQSAGAAITLLTSDRCPPDGLGRVVRNAAGVPAAIVEEREASAEQRDLREVNSGVYCLRGSWAWPRLAELKPRGNGELYLTDLVALAASEGAGTASTQPLDPWEVFGVNDRVHLAQAEAVLRERLCRRWMLEGVTILHPPSTFIDAAVQLGQDTILYPNTFLLGSTRVGRDCRLGPNAIVRDSILGNGCVVVASVLEGAVLEPQVEVGPFSHLRPETYVETGVHIGNFAEVKKSRLGRGSKMGHFCYVGDATLGAEVNVGAGTITCNFDGVEKHLTVVEEGAFLGSDTLLVAPVRVGARAATGAGAVVTRDVPPDTLAVGMPARPRKRVKRPRAP